MPDHNEEFGYCDLSGNALEPEAAAIVVFGATGDLSRRKIFPALYNLERMQILPSETVVIGFARRELSSEAFIEEMRGACAVNSHSKPLDEGAWERLSRRISYFRGSFDDEAAYRGLARVLAQTGMPVNALFYLAVAPEEFANVALGLARVGLGAPPGSREDTRRAAGEGFRRLVVEKPFGSDLESARSLNATLQSCFAEDSLFRIDHYLGKETVQNLLYLRFANSIFEPLWNRNHIESVEIDVLETSGIGSRGGYYDRAGAARDMLQNHLIQLLCLVAMEPPTGLDPESVRGEKVKVLKSIREYSSDELLARSVRGQYSMIPADRAGSNGAPRLSYLDEARVAPGSRTETFVSLRLEVDNWRFAGVPFTLRTGKALDRQVSEIRVLFKRPPATLFAGFCGDLLLPNALTVRIQPDEGMWLRFNAKEPAAERVAPKELRFAYRERNDAYFPEAYERLIADALAGDSTLFIRSDETEEAWRIVDALENAWASGPPPLLYPIGSTGPGSRPAALTARCE
jgi:glucose-6-phosphate 1-dehydrogenase